MESDKKELDVFRDTPVRYMGRVIHINLDIKCIQQLLL